MANKQQREQQQRSKVVVIDGANIAYLERSKDGKPKVSNIQAVRRELEERGFDPITIVDASLIHEVDDPDQLDNLIRDERVRQVPAGTDADFFVLETADHEHAQVVSNDRFEPYREKYPWIKDRRVPLMIVEGHVQLYERDLQPAP